MHGTMSLKFIIYMNFGTTRLRGRPRNRWQDEVREDGRIVVGEGWQGKVHNREERKKLLITARNRRILHMTMERMNRNHHHQSPPPPPPPLTTNCKKTKYSHTMILNLVTRRNLDYTYATNPIQFKCIFEEMH